MSEQTEYESLARAALKVHGLELSEADIAETSKNLSVLAGLYQNFAAIGKGDHDEIALRFEADPQEDQA